MAGKKNGRRKRHKQSHNRRSSRPAAARSRPVAAAPAAQPSLPVTSQSVAPAVPQSPAFAEKQAPPALRVWKNRNYALFESGWMPQSITSWIQRVGVTWLAWELSHSNAWVGAIAAADLAPMIVLAPIAGAMVDRAPDPMRLLRLTKFLLLLQAVILAGLMYGGLMTIEMLLALSLVTGLINPYASAARQLVLAGSVRREDFAAAIALDSALFHACRFIGPAIAALMIATWDVASTFLAHIFGSSIVIAALYMMRVPPPERHPRGRRSLLVDIAESLRYTRQSGAIWPLFLMLTVASMLLRPVQDLLPGFASKVFHAGAEGLGWLASSMGVGAMVSATWIALRGRVDGLSSWAIAGGLILILATLGFAASDQLWLGLVFAGLSAFGLNTMSTSIQTITQSVVSDGMRGRVMSLYSLIFRGFPAVGALVLGSMADRIGLPTTFALMSILSLMVWALVALQWRTIDASVRRELG